jgi:hypothetical protein
MFQSVYGYINCKKPYIPTASIPSIWFNGETIMELASLRIQSLVNHSTTL